MKVIIAGARNISDQAIIFAAVASSPFVITEVVSGCAKGVDIQGEFWAARAGLPCKRFPADWNGLGIKAGPLRNQQMADYADALIAIWDGESPGTKDMIRRAEAKQLPVFIYRV